MERSFPKPSEPKKHEKMFKFFDFKFELNSFQQAHFSNEVQKGQENK
jgi:hypothetical protein